MNAHAMISSKKAAVIRNVRPVSRTGAKSGSSLCPPGCPGWTALALLAANRYRTACSPKLLRSVFADSIPFPFRQVNNLRFGSEVFQQLESARTLCHLRYFAFRVVYVAEIHCLGGAALDTSSDIIAVLQLPLFTLRNPFCFLQPVMTERALFNHADRPHRHVWIQTLLHLSGPAWPKPVEILNRVRAGVGAITTADAARIDLSDQPFLV